ATKRSRAVLQPGLLRCARNDEPSSRCVFASELCHATVSDLVTTGLDPVVHVEATRPNAVVVPVGRKSQSRPGAGCKSAGGHCTRPAARHACGAATESSGEIRSCT